MKSAEECQTIDDVRSEIDRIDRGMVEALAERRRYVHAIMRFKQDEEDIHALERQAAVIATRRQWAEEVGLSPDLVEHLYRDLIAHFIKQEMDLLAKREET